MSQNKKQKIAVIIPVFNEEESITRVLNDTPGNIVEEVVVVDNGSTDSSAEIARDNGATVLHEPKLGYGAACLYGINYLQNKETKPDILIFLDGDYSDFPEDML